MFSAVGTCLFGVAAEVSMGSVPRDVAGFFSPSWIILVSDGLVSVLVSSTPGPMASLGFLHARFLFLPTAELSMALAQSTILGPSGAENPFAVEMYVW